MNERLVAADTDEDRSSARGTALVRLARITHAQANFAAMARWAGLAHEVRPSDTTLGLVQQAQVCVEIEALRHDLEAIGSPQVFLGAGLDYKKRGEPEYAIAIYLLGRRRYPQDTRLLNASAGALRKLSRPDLAASAARDSLAINASPDSNCAALTALGHALHDLGDRQAALELAGQVLKVRPKDAHARFLEVRATGGADGLDLAAAAIREGIDEEWFWKWLAGRREDAQDWRPPQGRTTDTVAAHIDALVDKLGGWPPHLQPRPKLQDALRHESRPRAHPQPPVPPAATEDCPF